MVLLLAQPMALPVLLVDSERDSLATMAALLEASGYDPTVTDDFENATALLAAGGFVAVITAERLGPHNGLHLVLRARAARPPVGVIVTIPRPDQIVEAEATVLGALCVVAPWKDPSDLLSALARVQHALPV